MNIDDPWKKEKEACSFYWPQNNKIILDVFANDAMIQEFKKYQEQEGVKFPSRAEEERTTTGSTDFGNFSYVGECFFLNSSSSKEKLDLLLWDHSIHHSLFYSYYFYIYIVPGIHPGFSINTNAANHTIEFTKAAGTPEAHALTIRAARSLAKTAASVFLDDALYERVVADFKKGKPQ